MSQPIYTPRFPVRGCRKPSRLHSAYRFALNVVEVRKAADEEVAHGHVHGPHGHHHHDDDEDGDQFRSVPLQ